MREPLHHIERSTETRSALFPPWPVVVQDLAGRDLAYADLRGVDARGTVFDLADLTAADCTAALMQGARLRHAKLDSASLRQALLLSAHLECASIQATDFTGANCEWAWGEGLDFQATIVSCALFLNVRGLSASARRTIEARGGFTGARPMILGRELYESPLSGPDLSPIGGGGGI